MFLILYIARHTHIKHEIKKTNINSTFALNFQEKVAASVGWDHIISCLGGDLGISKEAIHLLQELLLDRSGWNQCFCKKLSQNRYAVSFLVTLLKDPVNDSAEVAEKILKELFEINEDSIVTAATCGWYKPLVDRMVRGKNMDYFLVVTCYCDEFNIFIKLNR